MPTTEAIAPQTLRPPKPPTDERRRVEIRCADCGYGGVVTQLPKRCPMCGGSSWIELRSRSPRA